MSHTIREKHKLLARVRRIRGQVEALERSVAEEAGCDRVMHQIVGIRGAVAGLMAEVVEDHVRNHLMQPQKDATTQAAEQLIDVMHSYLK
jgi:DNA-binding FrmR family transcriptional regulator